MNGRFRELIRRGVDQRLLHDQVILHGGKGGAPAAPDYTAAAIAQAQASERTTREQTYANRPTQNTPWGSTRWETGTMKDPATGQEVTTWTQNQTLDPKLQRALNDQLAIQKGRSNLAGTFMNRVKQDYAQPFNWGSLPQGSAGPEAGNLTPEQRMSAITQSQGAPGFSADRTRIEGELMDRMRPEHARQEDATRTMLANKGLTEGSEAYNRELERLHQNQAGERWNAVTQAGNEQSRLEGLLMARDNQAFGQQAQAGAQNFQQEQVAGAQNFQQGQAQADFANKYRQQAIAEQAQKRGMSLNELNALLTGQQVQTPGMPTFMGANAAQPAQLLQAAGMQGQYGLNAAQQDQGQFGNWAQLAGAAGMMMSDRRLKSRIRRIGTHPIGVGIYVYDIAGRKEIGVIAQEVQEVRPDLVHRMDSGYLTVNYGGL